MCFQLEIKYYFTGIGNTWNFIKRIEKSEYSVEKSIILQALATLCTYQLKSVSGGARPRPRPIFIQPQESKSSTFILDLLFKLICCSKYSICIQLHTSSKSYPSKIIKIPLRSTINHLQAEARTRVVTEPLVRIL